MRWPIISPGRVGAPVLEPGDSVALADRYGQPVGEWTTIVGDGEAEVLRLLVPPGAGPVKCYLVRDHLGRLAWWSDNTWHPAAQPGDWCVLPLRRHFANVERAAAVEPAELKPTKPRPGAPVVAARNGVSPAAIPARGPRPGPPTTVRWRSP